VNVNATAAGAPGPAILIVPCYNEADRLDDDALLSLVAGEIPPARLLLVDDGSRDQTRARLDALARRAPPGRIDTLALPQNRGKAEAVRQGMQRALDNRAAIVGYFDADLSTPVPEILRLLALLAARDDVDAVIGARISLMGHDIRRSHRRHYLGRVFATLASLILQAQVYDTQCGAKLFRRSPALQSALREPFLSRWSFDVELLGRLLVGDASVSPITEGQILEVPLRQWRDVPGSKLRLSAMAGALKELADIAGDLARRRRAAAGQTNGNNGTHREPQ
jgi:glycosyltransferase involved in cell wall biosynthesis